MALSEVTRRAVLRAVEEFDRLGRDPFLERYGFSRARSYLLRFEERSYDSKAILGAAHGFLPGRSPLRAADFSGGAAHAARALEGLGFEVVRDGGRVPAAQPGGSLSEDGLVDLVRRLKVSSTPDGPSRHQPIALLWAIGRAYRGEPRLVSWAETKGQLERLLAAYGRPSQRDHPEYPLAALAHAGLWEMQGVVGPVPKAHGDARLKAWFSGNGPRSGLVAPARTLVRSSGVARLRVVGHLLDGYFGDLADPSALLRSVGLEGDALADDLVPVYEEAPTIGRNPVALAATYERLCQLAANGEPERRGRRNAVVRNAPVRSAAARRGVLERSGGRCENPRCAGQPTDVTDRGLPILDVDHVDRLADGGRDHPSVMIALCPNCHAVKTRGTTRHTLAEELLAVALARHSALLRSPRS